MTPKSADDVCVVYLYLYALIVSVGAAYDGWLTYTGRRMVTDYLRAYGADHWWFILASSGFIGVTAMGFVIAAVLHLWAK